MCHLKSSFNHSLIVKIDKVIVDLCEENIHSKCFSWNLNETQTFKACSTKSYCIIPVKNEQKYFLIIKYSVRRKNIELLQGNHSYWKKFHAKSHKKQKIFFRTPVTKFQKISTLNICNEAKKIYPKKQKKVSKKRYSTSFRSSHPKVLCKKGVLKNFATCLFVYYWNRHQVEDKNL